MAIGASRRPRRRSSRTDDRATVRITYGAPQQATLLDRLLQRDDRALLMDFTSALFVLAFAVAAVVGVVVARRRSRTMTAVFARLSAELGGEVKEPFGAYPVLTFPLDSLEATASAISGGGHNRPHTFVYFYLPSFPSRSFFVIASSGFRPQTMGRLRYATIELSDPVFDEAFTVRSRDEALARSLLTESLRGRLMEIRARHVIDVVLGDAPLHEAGDWVERPRLSISIRGVATGYDDYRMLIDALTAFHARLRQIDVGADGSAGSRP